MSPSSRRYVRGIAVLGASSALVAGTLVPAQAADVELTARMQPTKAFPNARGHASYEADHGDREFEISIAGVRKLHGKRVTVRVHGSLVGRMVINRHGRAHLDRHTSVRMHAGDAVRVRARAGTLVTDGTLRRHHD